MPTGNSNEILKARVVTVSGDTAEVITEGDFRRGKTPGWKRRWWRMAFELRFWGVSQN